MILMNNNVTSKKMTSENRSVVVDRTATDVDRLTDPRGVLQDRTSSQQIQRSYNSEHRSRELEEHMESSEMESGEWFDNKENCSSSCNNDEARDGLEHQQVSCPLQACDMQTWDPELGPWDPLDELDLGQLDLDWDPLGLGPAPMTPKRAAKQRAALAAERGEMEASRLPKFFAKRSNKHRDSKVTFANALIHEDIRPTTKVLIFKGPMYTPGIITKPPTSPTTPRAVEARRCLSFSFEDEDSVTDEDFETPWWTADDMQELVLDYSKLNPLLMEERSSSSSSSSWDDEDNENCAQDVFGMPGPQQQPHTTTEIGAAFFEDDLENHHHPHQRNTTEIGAAFVEDDVSFWAAPRYRRHQQHE